MKKPFLLSISLFLLVAFFSVPAKAENIVPDDIDHVDSFSVLININADSTFSVSENVNYNFGKETRSGITRYIPLNYKNLNGDKISIKVDDVSVVDENGNSYVFSQNKIQSDDKKKSYLKIEIGDENQPVSGSKTYVIRYLVSGAIKYSNDHDELFWNITGDKWSVYVKYPEVKIDLPQDIDNDKISKECYIGLHEATIDCIDRLNNKKDIDAYYSYKGVVSGEGMTVVLDFPKGMVQKKVAIQQSFWSSLKADHWMQGIITLSFFSFITITILIKIYFRKIAKVFSWKRWIGKIIQATEKAKISFAKKFKNKGARWWVAAGVVFIIILISGGSIFWKIENTLNKISTKGESIGSIVQASFDNQQIKGESDGQINVLLLGMLGANHPGGGLNTDTIMVVSIRPGDNKISLVSIPRDLWVVDPGKDSKSKINAVYAYGEEKGAGQGISDMEKLVGDITGLPIHYAVVVSTEGFTKLVDTLGGVEIELSKPFNESVQFTDIKVCDSETYTIQTSEVQYKKDKKNNIVAQYPLCRNKNPECGGNFNLPAGKNILSGEQALCFSRSRYMTSDFERAKRQQLILQQLKKKVTQLGLTDFGKINPILDNMGDNVRTDMQLWEMRRLFDLYQGMDNANIYQWVLEDSKEGLLYSPDKTRETGFILLPRGNNYDKIKKLFQNIFNGKKQSDIESNI